MPELQIVPIAQLAKAQQVFRCVPYSCAMAARRCVERQAQADSKFPPPALVLCKGCESGALVKQRIGDQVQIDPNAAHLATQAARRPSPPAGSRRAPADDRLKSQLDTQLVKNPDAVLLGQLGGAKGGPARAAALSPDERSASAKKAADARWSDPRRIDMAGRELAGVRVLREGETTHAGICWVVEHLACGHVEEVAGQVLRLAQKNGSRRGCQECRDLAADAAAPKPERPEETDPAVARLPLKTPPEPVEPEPPAAQRAPPRSTETTTYTFPLRRDFALTVELPADLNKADVSRLARWIETLVFEDA